MSLDAPSALPIRADRLRVAVVAARFNPELVDGLLAAVLGRLAEAGLPAARVRVVRVPGSHEVPVVAQWLAAGGRCDSVVALGVLIRGGTAHHSIVAGGVTHALQHVAVTTGVPVINGVIVAENRRQARDRCVGRIGRGREFADAALAMAALRRHRGNLT